MNILAQRQTPYPGSEITIEETLEPGANYSRYIASYQSEGLKIYALLTVPYGDTPETGWPAIVFNHGYIPPNVYRTTERYIAYVDSLASHGYIVFRIDYRGHDRSEGTATGAYGHPGYTVDVLNAVAGVELAKAALSQAEVARDFSQKRLDAEQRLKQAGIAEEGRSRSGAFARPEAQGFQGYRVVRRAAPGATRFRQRAARLALTLLAEVILRAHEGRSVGELFNE